MDCNLGSEIGQKMRSAVKAKLLELGTGNSAGFIDDELPDYVMVMVANKRTKHQMNAELNLFLGDQTDLFVTWLHEVLQKLQEVTLPASSAISKKRKSRQSEGPKAKDKEKDKDKKSRDKKDKKAHRKSGDELAGESTTRSADVVPAITSITDVFAEELLEKAKKTLDVDMELKDELLLKKKKRKSTVDAVEDVEQAPDFDIPTISEISSTTNSGNREKDMAELAEIQRKIYAAKQHLRQIGELDDESDEDEQELQQVQQVQPQEEQPSEDVLSLLDQEETLVEDPTPAPEVVVEAPRKAKSPIVFNRAPDPAVTRDKPKLQQEVSTEERSERSERLERSSERRSVHERLGSKPPTLPERVQRTQKELELYVPAHRRQQEERGREAARNQPSRRRERESEKERVRSRRSPSPSTTPKQRIGSRVIVAINKPPEPSDDEDILDKPVNSVIKIKPRPLVSPRRQACKNLLLRAVADAQRSTILAKTVSTPIPRAAKDDEPELISSTLGKRRLNESVPGKELFRRSRRELVVNVLQRDAKRKRQTAEVKEQVETLEDEEYVPSLNVSDFVTYVPQMVPELDVDIDMHIEKNDNNGTAGSTGVAKTQFVVTLNGEKTLGNPVAAAAVAAVYRRRSRKRTPSPQVSSTSSTTVQLVNVEATSTTCTSSTHNARNNKSKRSRSSSHSSPTTSSTTPPPKLSRSVLRSEVLRQSQTDLKKIIINATDEEHEDHLGHKRAFRKRSHVAPSSSNDIKVDSKPQSEELNRSTTPPLPPKQQNKRDISREKSSTRVGAKESASAATLEAPAKAKHTPIHFKLKPEEKQSSITPKKRRSGSKERESSSERRRISIRKTEDKKYDNLPALSAVSVDSAVLKVTKPKERCKYHPNCSKQFCEYYHPSAPCKSFPNCKFADKCMYSHPKCKFDLSCISIDCNFAHSGTRDLSHVQHAAPPLSSHVIPVQNYKSISAPATGTTATTMCKYYPNCTKAGCTFYHPKPCRYGKNCINKLECIFYHPEMQSKFKWVASLG